MKKFSCLVGNSCSGIREGVFLGTSVVNIGSMQDMRERGNNVVDIISSKEKIDISIRQQMAQRSYSHQPIYGDGMAGKNIANIVHELKNVNVQ